MLDVIVNAVCLLGLSLVFVFVFVFVCRRARFWIALSRVPGPPSLPLLGNALQLTGEQDEFFRFMCRCAEKYGDIFRLWIGTRVFIFLYRAEAIQPILNSSVHIDKSYEYSFLLPWIRTGLLTSSGEKWHKRRKLLSNSFHSNILEDFLEPVYRESLIFADRLRMELNKPSFDIVPYAKLCALDTICDTAMGANMNAQRDSDSAYVTAIDRMREILQRRFITPWLKPDAIFYRTHYGKEQTECLKIVHSFSEKVINERKQERLRQVSGATSRSNVTEKRRRLALLDRMLEDNEDGIVLTYDDIREEVDTFIFAGHDTASTAVAWCLYVLGHHSDVQDKVAHEIQSVMAEDEKEWPTMKQLQKLVYLERCIKETFRLYPVVPLIARDIKHPVQIMDYKLPAGVTILFHTYLLHRDPRFFPNPNIFDPDRFLPENCESRHPFAYIPFSAGSRNCIGQKFAMMEIKLILATVLCRYIVKSIDTEEKLNLIAELALINKEGIRLAITSRT
ncbi:cytochrome P450 4c3-like [Periplaneta americana]|uniref:cytochrome P450 4c3-like n=1 Tax=Periplaneta americana TaxID=6978 RepID=UPI0037E8903F